MRFRVLFLVGMLLLLGACGAGEPESIPTSPPAIPDAIAPTAAPPTTEPTMTSLPAVTTTSEAPTTTVDVTPPELRVLVPRPNERVAERHFRFEGVTEPGVSLVAAARYPAVVDADGSWSIVLVLNPGGNVAGFAATDEGGNTTELRVPVYYDPPFELRADGLGPARFTDPMEATLETLNELLGAPSRDEIVTRDALPPELRDNPYPIHTATAYPGMDYARFVTWESAGLMVMFSDESTEFAEPAAPNFNGWILRDPGKERPVMVTAEGIGIGATVAALEKAYGALHEWFEEPDELTGAWHYLIDSGIPSAWSPDSTYSLYGHFDGDPSLPGTVITRIQAGFGFDEC